jgi:hypothetical protein
MIFMIGECTVLCENCVREETTPVEMEYLCSGNKFDITTWPVRDKQTGATLRDEETGEVLYREITEWARFNPQPRTFDGEAIEAYSDYGYEDEGDGLCCEGCSAEIIEPHKAECKVCGEEIVGRLAQSLDNAARWVFCPDCIERLEQAQRIKEKLQELYAALVPVRVGRRPLLDLGPDYQAYNDAYFHVEGLLKQHEESFGPYDFHDLVASEMDKYEYLASRGGAEPAQTLFNLFEHINAFTHVLEGVDEGVGWEDLENNLPSLRRALDEYNRYYS